MTDKEKFQNTFEKLHSSSDTLTEVMKMISNDKAVHKSKRKSLSTASVACLTLVLVVGSSSIAYANNLGGIQRTIQLWIHGDQTNATLVVDSGTYNLEYQDADGNTVHRGGGGVAINPDGSERPLTEEELMEEINAPEVIYKEDGSVWIYYFDQKQDITDKFEDDVCYMKLQYNDKIMYLTIKYQNGYSYNKYISPWEFN